MSFFDRLLILVLALLLAGALLTQVGFHELTAYPYNQRAQSTPTLAYYGVVLLFLLLGWPMVAFVTALRRKQAGPAAQRVAAFVVVPLTLLWGMAVVALIHFLQHPWRWGP